MQKQIMRLVKYLLVRQMDFTPWQFFNEKEQVIASKYLMQKYPVHKIFCFAQNGDDHACLVLSGDLSNKFIIVHDFADIGWEFIAGSELNTFGEVLTLMLQNGIEIEDF